jgi:hypothetical protein
MRHLLRSSTVDFLSNAVSDLRDEENIVLERFLVHTELASLTEPGVAANVVAQERLLILVDITVFLEVLGEREFLCTLWAGELALFDVGGEVAAEREAGGVLLVAGLSVT